MAGEVAYALAYDWHSSLEYFDSDTVLVRYDARTDDPRRVDVRKRFLRVFASERAFVRRVWSTVAELREAGRRVVVLFDIDQTLGSRKGRDGQTATLVRPAAPLLMARLHEAGVVMGILTTRGISELHRNLTDVLHLGGVAPYLDRAHLTAAEMERYHSDTPTVSADRVTGEVFERFRPLLRPPYDDLEVFRAHRDARGHALPGRTSTSCCSSPSCGPTTPRRRSWSWTTATTRGCSRGPRSGWWACTSPSTSGPTSETARGAL